MLFKLNFSFPNILFAFVIVCLCLSVLLLLVCPSLCEQECAAGFYRLRAGSLAPAPPSRAPTAVGMGSCVQCQCSGHSSTCDPETSICQVNVCVCVCVWRPSCSHMSGSFRRRVGVCVCGLGEMSGTVISPAIINDLGPV